MDRRTAVAVIAAGVTNAATLAVIRLWALVAAVIGSQLTPDYGRHMAKVARPKDPPVEPAGVRWQDHISLIAAGALLVLGAARLLRVSHFNANTATAILSYAGTANAAFTVLLATAPAAIAGVAAGHLARNWTGIGSLAKWPTIALLVAGMVTPWPVAATLAVLMLIDIVPLQRKGARTRRAAVPPDGLIYVFGALMVLLAPDRPWLALEQVNSAKSASRVGYVLDASAIGIVFLDDASRTVIRIPHEEVTSRVFCEHSTGDGWLWGQGTILSLILNDDEPTYPPCDKP